jgi:hypothetical protein
MWYGEKDFLDQLHRSWPRSGFHSAVVVGAGGDDPYYLRQLVDRIPQRLVLKFFASSLLA